MNLDPVRRVRLDRARREAERLVADARASRERMLAGARSDAGALIEQARELGGRDADWENQGFGSETAQQAREAVLTARRAAYDSLVAAAVRAALVLRDDPAYPALLEALRAVAVAQLGPGAVVESDRPGAGGVIAHAGARRVDYSLPALALRCLESLGPRVEELWR